MKNMLELYIHTIDIEQTTDCYYNGGYCGKTTDYINSITNNLKVLVLKETGLSEDELDKKIKNSQTERIIQTFEYKNKSGELHDYKIIELLDKRYLVKPSRYDWESTYDIYDTKDKAIDWVKRDMKRLKIAILKENYER